jgi:hypothetical protein
MGSLAFLPAGMALAGPVAAGIGIAPTLWISAGWVAASTAVLLVVPDVRNNPARRPGRAGTGMTSELA